MAIRVGYEPVQAVQKLSELAGKAQAGEREAQRQHELARRAQDIQAQQQMAQYQAELNMKAQQMAMDWELQKMQLTSMHDFELEEFRRDILYKKQLADEIKKNDEFELIKKQINEADYITPEQKEDALNRATLRHYGYNPNEILGQTLTPQERMLQESMSGLAGGEGNIQNQPIPKTASTPMIANERAGKIRVIAPSGKTGNLPTEEWPEYKAKGYELASTSLRLFYENEKKRNSLNPITKKQGQIELDKLAKKYPTAWRKYLNEIKAGRKVKKKLLNEEVKENIKQKLLNASNKYNPQPIFGGE